MDEPIIDVLARRFARQDILLVLDGAPNHRCGDLAVPNNITLLYLPPYSPELNPKENLWDEIREKIFKNYALKSMDAVRAKLKQAILYIERNPKLVRSISSFPISSTHSDVELVLGAVLPLCGVYSDSSQFKLIKTGTFFRPSLHGEPRKAYA
jgi:transposase